MHDVMEGELDAIEQPTVLFSRIDKIELPELANSDTNPLENYQDNGAMPPVNTQPSLLQSPL